MSRDNWDIPEVFRRAMEEAGWESNKGEGGKKYALIQKQLKSMGSCAKLSIQIYQ